MQRLFLLDGMALVYRAHFALIARPIFTSKGVNSSALYGFTQTLLDILAKEKPTHIGAAFDTDRPTLRHADFPDYKAHREVMPEDLSKALPYVFRMLEAFRIPVLKCDGYEADDLIGTIVRRAEKQGFQCYMVTPDKDFGQLVTENILIYKPGRMGSEVEILGLPEIRNRWGVQKPQQVVDVLALMGDSSDNIPGVPGIGEKTAIKLIGEYDSVENLLAHVAELTGRVKESLEKNREVALLSKKLATLDCNAPCLLELDSLEVRPPDEERLKALLVEFEFNSIGRRIFGENFKAGRGFQEPGQPAVPTGRDRARPTATQQDFQLAVEEGAPAAQPAATPEAGRGARLETKEQVPHEYEAVISPKERAILVQRLLSSGSFSLGAVTTGTDPKSATLTGVVFSLEPHRAFHVSLASGARTILNEFRPVLESTQIEKIGHDLKFDLNVLRWQGITVRGKLFDTMLSHSLVEPGMRHSLDYLSEAYLGYTPVSAPVADKSGESVPAVPAHLSADAACERADLALQLRNVLAPLLKVKAQEKVFYEIEAPLIPVLVEMEHEGIRVDAGALAEFSLQLGKEIGEQEKTVCRMAGTTFNLNSPRQLGQVLFDVMKICEPPKKTRTGQYSTDEQTLAALAPDHEIVRRLLEYRMATKLKTTYADALPAAIWPATGRIHTTYNQVMTATGRLNSQDPNLQNIPIRRDRGQEIRRAFVPRDANCQLLSADYSQIELRIIAALSHEAGLLEAFQRGLDVHTATAARVFGVPLEGVTQEMRRKAKMVNYGIAYGISAFGLAQRLAIPRKEAGDIIDQYFQKFPGVRKYMDDTIAFAREHGYVETVTGRRRYLRDITSSNNTIRSSAERNAINAPIQGTAADMIKLAMILIQTELERRKLKTRMLLQVHDELVFDLYRPEEQEVRSLVEDKMKNAIRLEVPMEVEIGVGDNWLEAH